MADRNRLHVLVDGRTEAAIMESVLGPHRRSRGWLLCPTYAKTIDGPLAVFELGLSVLRARCPHLDGWLTRLDGMVDRFGS